MTPLLVSVIIPTYNRASTVGRSIASALGQSYRPIEVIVVDDGSTDNTREILGGYGEEIIVVVRKNGGPSAARNSGVEMAKGEIIAFLDSDDTWGPEKIERQVRLMDRGGEDVPCCVCNAALLSDQGSSATSFEVAGIRSELKEGFWTNPSPVIASRFILFNQVVAIRKSAFEKVGGFKPHMRLLEDHDLAFRLSLLGPWAFISDPLVEKYDESDGLSLEAMRDHGRHARAWEAALTGFLEEPVDPKGKVGKIIRRALRDVATEIKATDFKASGRHVPRTVGRMMMLLLRLRQKVRRRLPSWPRAAFVPALE